ncbi:transporter substrate-binding domain-containing protein [Ramlibacter albus]|uniref:Transporter substrate-binding domain-containing protein n=1 Tax=Ramlibacter albus TaxID=2079448 RepID=A0A923MF22_9BURK|nr:transporter substrate-binding domain-containing protein [Ramlibacter albus]MBC5767822.1 transporter substrate-binding domain-containing protein [Ramlibacter albus]
MTHPIGRRALLWSAAGLAVASAVPARAQGGSTMEQIKARKVLRVGATPAEPWFYKDPVSEKWSGVAVSLGEQMAKDLGVGMQLVETTWANAPAAIQANQLDVQFILDPTDVRKQVIDFPEAPLLYYALGALLRPGLTAKAWSDMDKPDIKVGVTIGTNIDQMLTAMFKQAKIERFANNDEAVAAFAARRVDVVSQFHPALLVQQTRVKMGTVIIPTPATAVATSVGLRKDSDPTFRNWVSDRIADYYKTGKTQALFAAYMKGKGLDPDKMPGVMKEKW